jgi:hypothetical protein
MPFGDIPRREAVGLLAGFILGSLVTAVSWGTDLIDRLFPSAQLGRLYLNNQDASPREFRIDISVSGTRQYDRTVTVDGDSDIYIEDDLPAERGRVSLTATVTDARTDENTVSRTFRDDACYGVGVNYSQQHGLWLTTGAPIGACHQ